ncbi:RING-H2 finger protein ATL2-like [Macadamia integrifolia]|uniref:RING-H2 finger protein ATL2-like n=1 Tax=Macadamia integrifolia TaxID=60698 RepID=UPI001C500685|nr:RING-H2 finger protein ATL2-like [Macadamia integrifolia]
MEKYNSSSGDPRGYSDTPSGSYALSGKIMLSAIVILFSVVILILCLHVYARWFLLRESRRHPERRNRRRRVRRRTRIVFSIEPSGTSANSVLIGSRGLDESVVKSLPTFVYSSATHGCEVLECAVCLSEFEDDEKGRLLPKCNHSFHIDCIDMWFHSHSTCPLCRTIVTSEIPAVKPNETPAEVSVTVGEPESGSSSGLCPSCVHDRGETGSSSASSPPSSSSAASSSLGTREKPLETVTISIEVPRRNDILRGLEEEHLYLGSPGVQGLKSPIGQQGLRSPIQSLKRIFSRERKGNLSPSSPVDLSYSTATEIDLENGRRNLSPSSDNRLALRIDT